MVKFVETYVVSWLKLAKTRSEDGLPLPPPVAPPPATPARKLVFPFIIWPPEESNTTITSLMTLICFRIENCQK